MGFYYNYLQRPTAPPLSASARTRCRVAWVAEAPVPGRQSHGAAAARAAVAASGNVAPRLLPPLVGDVTVASGGTGASAGAPDLPPVAPPERERIWRRREEERGSEEEGRVEGARCARLRKEEVVEGGIKFRFSRLR